MKFFTSRTIFILLFFLIYSNSAFTAKLVGVNKPRTLYKYGKEIKFSILPTSNLLSKSKITAKDVISNAASRILKAKVSEPDYYLLDSITNKDITLSTEADVEAKIEYKYDDNGRVTSMLSKQYDYYTDKMAISYKSLFQYGENYILESDYDYSGTEVAFEVYKTILDNDGNILQIKVGVDSLNLESFDVIENYMYENNLLKSVSTTFVETQTESMKAFYHYDVNARLDSVVVWADNGFGELLRTSMIGYSYDVSGKLVKEELSSWDDAWVMYANTTYEYDVNDNCSVMNYTEPLSEDFIISSEYSFVYNTAINQSNLFTGNALDDFKFLIKNQITQSKVKVLLNNEMLAEYQSDYHYALKIPAAIALRPETENVVLVYNVNSQSLILKNVNDFSGVTLKIFDATGKLIKSSIVKNPNAIGVNNLSHGLYFYKLTVGNESYNGKVII